MRIWIDESGSFSGLGKIPSPACVGALIVPDAKFAEMLRLYARLRPRLPKEKGEVKGKLLTAHDVGVVVTLLRQVEALFEICVLELGMHTLDDIQGHQERFAAVFGANITPAHNKVLREQVCSAHMRMTVLCQIGMTLTPLLEGGVFDGAGDERRRADAAGDSPRS